MRAPALTKVGVSNIAGSRWPAISAARTRSFAVKSGDETAITACIASFAIAVAAPAKLSGVAAVHTLGTTPTFRAAATQLLHAREKIGDEGMLADAQPTDPEASLGGRREHQGACRAEQRKRIPACRKQVRPPGPCPEAS